MFTKFGVALLFQAKIRQIWYFYKCTRLAILKINVYRSLRLYILTFDILLWSKISYVWTQTSSYLKIKQIEKLNRKLKIGSSLNITMFLDVFLLFFVKKNHFSSFHIWRAGHSPFYAKMAKSTRKTTPVSRRKCVIVQKQL